MRRRNRDPSIGGRTHASRQPRVLWLLVERHLEGQGVLNQDERGIMRDQGPPIAWFKDPAGNVIGVLEG